MRTKMVQMIRNYAKRWFLWRLLHSTGINYRRWTI